MQLLRRVMILCLPVLFLASVRGEAQSLIQPQVRMVTSALSDSDARSLDDLSVRITEYLRAFSPPLSTQLLPVRPIPVQVVVRLRSGDGTRYVGDVEMTMTRPLYGSVKQSPILVVSDREVDFEVMSGSALAYFGQELPTDRLMLRIIYHLLEGLVGYYDSFGLQGGDPILDYMKRQRSVFATAWDGGRTRGTLSVHTPERWLMEMESAHGAQLRELWYIYHREVLDSERSEVAEENLSLILPLMSDLYRQQQTPLLSRLISDAKAEEIASLIEEIPIDRATRLRAVFSEVFPTLVS